MVIFSLLSIQTPLHHMILYVCCTFCHQSSFCNSNSVFIPIPIPTILRAIGRGQNQYIFGILGSRNIPMKFQLDWKAVGIWKVQLRAAPILMLTRASINVNSGCSNVYSGCAILTTAAMLTAFTKMSMLIMVTVVMCNINNNGDVNNDGDANIDGCNVDDSCSNIDLNNSGNVDSIDNGVDVDNDGSSDVQGQ